MSFKFDPINQRVIEVREASRWERLKRTPASPLLVFKIVFPTLLLFTVVMYYC